MQNRKLAIFDFDGTIADSADWSFAIFNTVARKYGFRQITAEEREMLRDRTSVEILAYLGVPRWKLPLISRNVRKLAARDIDQIRLFPWVPDLFNRLKERGVSIAIVSSNAEGNVRNVLGAEVAPMVQHYATGAAVFGKARKFKKVIRKSGISSELASAIGDEIRDVEAARAAGISSLAVTWGFATPSALAAASPTRLVTRPEELVEWFER